MRRSARNFPIPTSVTCFQLFSSSIDRRSARNFPVPTSVTCFPLFFSSIDRRSARNFCVPTSMVCYCSVLSLKTASFCWQDIYFEWALSNDTLGTVPFYIRYWSLIQSSIADELVEDIDQDWLSNIFAMVPARLLRLNVAKNEFVQVSW